MGERTLSRLKLDDRYLGRHCTSVDDDRRDLKETWIELPTSEPTTTPHASASTYIARERKVHSREATTVGIEGEDEAYSNKFRKTQMPLLCSSFMIGIIPLQRNTTCLELSLLYIYLQR